MNGRCQNDWVLTNTSSSKLAEAKYRATRSPFRTTGRRPRCPHWRCAGAPLRARTSAVFRRPSSRAVRAPSFPLVRMLQKRQHAVGDCLPGRLVAGDGEDHEEERELFAGQALAVGVGPDEVGGDIPEVVLDPSLRRRMGVREHFDGAREIGSGVFGVLTASHLVAPMEEPLVVSVGYTHEAGDGLQGQMTGDVDHEVTRAVTLGSPHDPVGLFAEVVLEPGQGPGREAPVSHLANPGVPRRVHTKQEVLGGVACRVRLVQPANEGGVGLYLLCPTPGDRRDIGVARDGPKPTIVVIRPDGTPGVPPDGLIAAQPRELSREDASASRSGSLRSEVGVDGLRGHHGGPPCSAARWRSTTEALILAGVN